MRWICIYAARLLLRFGSFPISQAQTSIWWEFLGDCCLSSKLFFCFFSLNTYCMSKNMHKSARIWRYGRLRMFNALIRKAHWVKTVAGCACFMVVFIFFLITPPSYVPKCFCFSRNTTQHQGGKKCTAQHITLMCLMRPRSRFTHTC